jgi:hypothetical protein
VNASERRPQSPLLRSTAASSLGLALPWALPAIAQEPSPTPPAAEAQDPKGTSVRYCPDGLVIASGDGNYEVRIRWRLQFRASSPFDDEPETLEDFQQPDRVSLSIRRARLEVGGHAFRPWIGYYVEYDFPSRRLYDFRVTFERYEWLRLRLGQWKAECNRARRGSSGEQQFADRSIVNAPFTSSLVPANTRWRRFSIPNRPSGMAAGS